MAIPLTPEARYMRLGQLMAEMPDFVGTDEASPEKHKWLGRAIALAECGDPQDMLDAMTLKDAAQYMELDQILRVPNANKFAQIMHRVLARAELRAPAAAQGAFISAGDVYDAFAMVGKALGESSADVLLVDPYANESILEFAALAPETVTIRVLTTDKYKATLQPAATRWRQQYAQSHPLEISVSDPKLLHDRLIIVDAARTKTWTLGQSFRDLAARSPTVIARTTPEIAASKIDAYQDLWKKATPLP